MEYWLELRKYLIRNEVSEGEFPHSYLTASDSPTKSDATEIIIYYIIFTDFYFILNEVSDTLVFN